MSLRARLIAGLLALAAAALLALAGITYAEQRSFLQDRVDQQATGALGAVSGALDQRGINVPGAVRSGPERPDGHGDGRGGPGPSPGSVDLPPGTYGQRRDASGKVIGHIALSYGETALPSPKLPARLQSGRLITVGSTGGSGVRYRAVAFPTQDQPGTTVVAVPLREVDQTLHRLLLVEALVIVGVLMTMALAAWWVVGLGLRPLERIGRTADAIAGGELSRRVSPATPRTEVGRLGLALNAMLGRLEEAFAAQRASENRLRRFLADASHELRTPLASIRGYSELFRIGATRGEGETEKAMRRIEEEAARMGILVDDMLALARLEEVRDPIREDVDVAALAADAVQDARAIAPDRPIRLRAEGPAVILGDPHQLRQVLGNLVRNALVHTPAGTPVEVSVVPAETEVGLEVRDHGPGLPTSDPGELFERFWRADPGRGRGRAGAGLGLAIVAAVVSAHGGRVEACNADGGGASFSVWLPARPEPGREPEAAAEPAAGTTA